MVSAVDVYHGVSVDQGKGFPAPIRRVEFGEPRSASPSTHSTGYQDLTFGQQLIPLLPSLRAFGRSLTGRADSADDLVQETMVKALQYRAQFTPGTNLKAWLFTIMRNNFFTEFQEAEGRG